MAVVKLRTRGARAAEAGLNRLRSVVLEADDGSSPEVVSRVVTLLDRELSSRSGWRFVMVEPNLNSEVLNWLTYNSHRPLVAVRLWGELLRHLPQDSNEVKASRKELAENIGAALTSISEILSELESIGAIYRRREGRDVRFYIHPSLGTHLTGTIRDRAQAEAPKLRLVEPA
jgi:DNA-binding transcriptional ArsR family regulator